MKESDVPLLDEYIELSDQSPTSSIDSDRNATLIKGKSKLKRYARRTPLPLLQLAVLCLVRLAEPIAYTQIFPYVNNMMEYLKVTDQPSKIGFYSGLVDSVFAVCQLFTIFQWARLSDKIGRKPVILLGLTGVAISTSLFGFSTSLTWAIFSRSISGALSGNVAVMESIISEITDETNQAMALPVKAFSWNIGCIVGPIIGGNLANPFKQWPNSFGRIPIFQRYPYLLPCVVSAGLTAASIIIGIVFLKETLPSKVHKRSKSTIPLVSAPKMGVRAILASPIIRSILQNYFLLSLLGSSFEVVFVLMAYTPIPLGGLARSPEEIGSALAFSGVFGALIQILVFPYLQAKYDNIPLYRFLMLLWPIIYASLPGLGWVAGHSSETVLWVAIGLLLVVARSATMCFSVNVILIRNAAPSPSSLGATFGLSQSVACVARAGAPAFVSSLFALSKKHHVMQGQFVWVVMVVIGLLGLWSTYQVVDGGGQYRIGGEEDEEDAEAKMKDMEVV